MCGAQQARAANLAGGAVKTNMTAAPVRKPGVGKVRLTVQVAFAYRRPYGLCGGFLPSPDEGGTIPYGKFAGHVLSVQA